MATNCSQDRFYTVSPGKLLFKKPQKNKSESTVATIHDRKRHFQRQKIMLEEKVYKRKKSNQ